MGLFKKNANEAAYVGGKKHFADVIKNSGAGDLLVWRQPEEDFNDGSTLIVMPGEEAVFIKGGVIEQVFSNGTYILSTDNYPFISRWINARTGGVSTFNCVVYFVKKDLSVEAKWGMDPPIQVRDKILGINTKLTTRGAYKLCVDNVGVFITKMLGSSISCQHPQELDNYFFNEFQSKIRTVIAKNLNEQEELLGIDTRLDEFSESITPFFQEVLDEYGLKCIRFIVSAIDIDDNEPAKFICEDFIPIPNENDVQYPQDIVGAGLGMAMSSPFSDLAKQMFSSPEQENVDAEDPLQSLSRLKELLDADLISKDEYNQKKKEYIQKLF